MSKKSLYAEDARNKIEELVDDIRFGILETRLGDAPTHAVPMTTKEVDAQGDLWFISPADSDHNAHIEKDGRVQLLYADPGSREFLVLYGKASITRNKERLEELFSKTDRNWFSGPEDPNLTALQIRPSEGHYWDSGENKLVTLFKLGKAAITGEREDLGESGHLQP